MKYKYLLLTNDVEDHSIWHNSLRYETAVKVTKEGMPLLLDIYSELKIKSTFFFTGYMAENFPEVVKMIIPFGHEVGSHGYSHHVHEAFDVLPLKKQIEHLSKTKKILEDLSGSEVISFRAPALRINADTPKALLETGHLIDSSVASQRFDMFLSFGSRKKLKWLTAPRLPYHTASDDLTKRGESKLVEVPLSAFIFPFTSTTLRIFPGVTKMQMLFINFETSFNKKPVVFDIHPNEFIDETNEIRVIQRRTKSFISYLLKDIARGKLKIKNLGKDCIPLYKNMISYFSNKNYVTCTISDFCKENGLI